MIFGLNKILCICILKYFVAMKRVHEISGLLWRSDRDMLSEDVASGVFKILYVSLKKGGIIDDFFLSTYIFL